MVKQNDVPAAAAVARSGALPQAACPETPAAAGAGGWQPTPRPPALDAIAAEDVVELDVRDDLRNGREPFSRIMAARQSVPPGGAFCLRAIFEPVPLYAVFGRHGFASWTERLAGDDWRIWFYPVPAGERDV